MRYTVVMVPDGTTGGYVVYVPAIPGCTTQGDSLDDALAMALDAATGLLEVAIEHDEYVPTEPAGAVVASIEVDVSIPAETDTRVAVTAGMD